jgi:hypothetical protein
VINSTLSSVGCGVDSVISFGDGVGGGVSDTATGPESSCCNGSAAFDNGFAELERDPVWQADTPDRINKPITISFIIDLVDTLQRVNISEKSIPDRCSLLIIQSQLKFISYSFLIHSHPISDPAVEHTLQGCKSAKKFICSGTGLSIIELLYYSLPSALHISTFN